VRRVGLVWDASPVISNRLLNTGDILTNLIVWLKREKIHIRIKKTNPLYGVILVVDIFILIKTLKIKDYLFGCGFKFCCFLLVIILF